MSTISEQRPDKPSSSTILTFITILLISIVSLLSITIQSKGITLALVKLENSFSLLGFSILIASSITAGKLVLTYMISKINLYKLVKPQRKLMSFIRLLLIILSVTLMLLVIDFHFYKKQIISTKTLEIRNKYTDREITLKNEFLDKRQDLKHSFNYQLQKTEEKYETLISKIFEQMLKETSLVENVNLRIAPPYSYSDLLEYYENEFKKASDEISNQYNKDTSSFLKQFAEDQSELLKQKNQELSQETIEKYSNKYEAQNRNLNDTVKLLYQVGLPLQTFHMTFIIALMIMLIIEFTPIILASHLFTRVLEHINETTEDNSQTINSARIKSEKIDYANTH